MGAFVWMSGALASFCLMAIGGRELAGGVGTFQILLFRSVIGLAVVTLLVTRSRRFALFQTQRTRLHLLRNSFHFFGQYGWFLGIGLLPLAQVFALEFTTPLWTLLIASVFLRETLSVNRIAAIGLGFLGIYLILNPDGAMLTPAALIVVASAICYAVAHVSTKALSSTEDPLTILFYMCALQVPLGLLLSFGTLIWPTPTQWGWLVLIGLTALTAHFCITRAMQRADASVVVTLDFLRLPLIAGAGMLFYSEAFQPMLLLGAVCMLAGNLLNFCRPSARKSR